MMRQALAVSDRSAKVARLAERTQHKLGVLVLCLLALDASHATKLGAATCVGDHTGCASSTTTRSANLRHALPLHVARANARTNQRDVVKVTPQGRAIGTAQLGERGLRRLNQFLQQTSGVVGWGSGGVCTLVGRAPPPPSRGAPDTRPSAAAQ